MSDLYVRVKELEHDAQQAKPSSYKDGYLQALTDVLEILEELAWEAGDSYGY